MERLFDLSTKRGIILQNISDLLVNLPSMIFFFCFGIFLVYLSDRQIPAVLYDGQMITQHVHAGDSVVIDFKVDRTKICEVDYVHLMYDSTGTRFPLIDLPALKKRKIGAGDIIKIGLDVPKGMKPGPAVYESERVYVCNFTQRWASPLTAENPDVHFNIEP